MLLALDSVVFLGTEYFKVKVTLQLTVSQSVSLGIEPHLTVALSDERTGLSFVYAAGPRQVAFLGCESLGTRGHILLSQI
jgi:hypothetical protein